MYTHRALFSRLVLQICLFVFFSLYCRSASYPPLCNSVQSLVICINRYNTVQGQCMVCVHTQSESDNVLQKYGHLNFFQNDRRPPSWI